MDDDFELRPLRLTDEASFLQAKDSFMRTDPDFEFALGYREGVRFPEYVQLLDEWARGETLPEGYVPGSFLVGLHAGEVVGRISIRHQLNAYLEEVGGHIGYGVVERFRCRGFASKMLLGALALCGRVHGLSYALVTCDEDNVASRKVIERCGGVFERFASRGVTLVRKRRYWIRTQGTDKRS